MPSRFQRLPDRCLRLVGILWLVCVSISAHGMSVSPSPSTGTHTVSWSTPLGCTVVGGYPYYETACYSLQENGVDIASSGTSLQVSGRSPGTYQYQVYYRDYVIGTVWSEYPVEGPVSVTVGTDTDFNDDAPDYVQSNYYVRRGDINGDGKVDFFVTGADALRVVQDFLLVSNGGGYQVVLNLTSTQLSIVSQWAPSSLPVSRVDIDMDGYFDLLISEAVGGNSIAVLTRNAGTTPIGAVVVDESIRQAGKEIANAIQHPQETLTSYDSYNVYFDHWEYLWIPYPCYPDDWYFSCGWWEQWPVFVEVHGYDTYTTAARTFIEGNRAAMQNGSITATFTSASLAPGERVVISGAAGAAAGVIATRIAVIALRIAITAAVIPEAPIIITGALVAITAYGVYQAVNAVLSDPPPSDRGPLPSTTALPPDPFEPCNRTPRNPAEEARRDYPGAISEGSARYDLKKNLGGRGCPSPHQLADAHHIVPLNDNPGGTVGNQLRAILTRNGVNINESSNGVWLPRNANVATNAMTHEAAQEQEVLEEVQARLLDAEARGGGQGYAGNAIRDELELIGRQMGSGTFTIP